MGIQGWFPLGLTGLISLLSKGLKNLLQHHSVKVSALQRSAFFMVQLSDPYMTTGKTIALTRWTFVGKVMSLLFNGLSRFVIAFLPRSKHLLILWLRSLFAVILETKKVCNCFHFFPICLPCLFNKISPLQWVLRSRVFSSTLQLCGNLSHFY